MRRPSYRRFSPRYESPRRKTYPRSERRGPKKAPQRWGVGKSATKPRKLAPPRRTRFTREMLRKVRSKHTRPELAIRRILDDLGLRYTRHARDLPGTPDIVMRRFKLALFVHGCFWHGHDCGTYEPPLGEWWRRKIERTNERDAAAIEALRELGWRTMIVWECDTRYTRRLVLALALRN